MTPTRKERRVTGKAMRDKCARVAHGTWKPRAKRHDPIELLIESSAGRMTQLVPIRYGRMMQSRFAFYRVAGGYLGSNFRFDKAVAKFALAYTDQNERDYQALLKAIREGRIQTLEE